MKPQYSQYINTFEDTVYLYLILSAKWYLPRRVRGVSRRCSVLWCSWIRSKYVRLALGFVNQCSERNCLLTLFSPSVLHNKHWEYFLVGSGAKEWITVWPKHWSFKYKHEIQRLRKGQETSKVEDMDVSAAWTLFPSPPSNLDHSSFRLTQPSLRGAVFS